MACEVEAQQASENGNADLFPSSQWASVAGLHPAFHTSGITRVLEDC